MIGSDFLEKVHVLYFVDRLLRGGIQTFVLENWNHMDKNRIQIDFLLLDDGNKYELEDELKKSGSNVYKLKGIWLKNGFEYIKYWKALNNFFSIHNEYQIIHLHSASKNFIVLAAAKKHGIKVRIAHSHNIEFQTKSKIQIMVGNMLKIPLRFYATDYFACSYLAGKWLFGKKIADNKLHIIKNAVDINKFRYNKEVSQSIRRELGLRDEFVVGHVGRFTHQKNHSFLIDIFKEIKKLKPSSKLLLVGTGELETEIRKKVKQNNIAPNVIFAGFKNNVNEYMQAMDVFVFPSEYEGLGLVLIEAQAAGLYCFTSDKVVPKEAQVTPRLEYIDLSCAPIIWANQILKCDYEHIDVTSQIIEKGYDINHTAEQLTSFYFEALSQEKGL